MAVAVAAALAGACAHGGARSAATPAPTPPPTQEPVAPSPSTPPGEGSGPAEQDRSRSPREPIAIALVGDVMLGTTFPEDSVLPPDDARGLLAEAAPVLSAADLAIGNLEG